MQAWLYDISERIKALQDVLDEWDGESIAGDAIAAIYENDVPAAVADGIRYIKRQEAQTEEIDAEIKRLQALKKARENRLARVRRGYAEFMDALSVTKVETASGNMTLAKATPKTIVDSIEDLPDAYKKTIVEIKPDLTGIKQAILSGHTVKGAHLEHTPSIRIK